MSLKATLTFRYFVRTNNLVKTKENQENLYTSVQDTASFKQVTTLTAPNSRKCAGYGEAAGGGRMAPAHFAIPFAQICTLQTVPTFKFLGARRTQQLSFL